MVKSKMNLLFRWRWTPNGLERKEQVNHGRHLLATFHTSVPSVTSIQLMPMSLRNMPLNTKWKKCIHAHTVLILHLERHWWRNTYTAIQEKNRILVPIALTGLPTGITWQSTFVDTLEKNLMCAHCAHTKLHKSLIWMFTWQQNILQYDHYLHHLLLPSFYICDCIFVDCINFV